MSLLGSINTAVCGMTAQAVCLGNISDNLANTSTTGFKSVGTNFEDIVSSTAKDCPGNGVTASPIYYNSLQGSVSANEVGTYLAISGKGFFPVASENSDGSVNANSVLYTRTGDFSLNKDGVLSNNSNFFLMGWDVDPDTRTTSIGSVVPMQFSDYIGVGVATTKMDLNSNLPTAMSPTLSTLRNTTTIYDSEGINGHEVNYTWVHTAPNTWDLTIQAPEGAYDETTATVNDYTAAATFVFDASGQIESITSADCVVTGNSLSVPLSYQDQLFPFTAALTQTVAAGFDDLTQFTDDIVTNVAFNQNGAGKDMFSGITIDSEGFTSVNYSNGVDRTYYRVPIAVFNSPDHLQRMSGNVFRETSTSGIANYNMAGTNGTGALNVGALEKSNVDITDQFTRMIQAQRAYSANSRTVSVVDSMMQTLTTI